MNKEFLQEKINENLYEFFAKDIETARDSEIYFALAKTIRMLIGKNWNHSIKSLREDKSLYILSFEYSLGTRLVSNAIKLGIYEDILSIMTQNNRDFRKIADIELESALGFGDLGTISSSVLDTMANLEQKVHAYGLRYRKGMLKQEIIDGAQVERPDDWHDYKNPWEHEKSFSHLVNFNDFSLKAIPYDVPIVGNKKKHVNTLRLWKSESTEDIDFDLFSKGKIQDAYLNINRANSIVEFLYPQEDTQAGLELRLAQEYFFASASIQDIFKRYKKYTDNNIFDFANHTSIQIHDIHPVLAQLVFIKMAQEKYGISFDQAIRICQDSFIFVSFSLINEAFQKWPLSMIEKVCPDLIEIIEQLDHYSKRELKKEKLSQEAREAFKIVKNQQIEMINVAFLLSKKILVPTRQYKKVLEEVYLPFHRDLYKDRIKVIAYLHPAEDFLEEVNPCLYHAIEENLIVCSDHRCEIDPKFRERFFQIKTDKKRELLEDLGIQAKDVNIHSIFNMNLGIFHEYKRQLLSALSIALLYYRLKQNGNLDIPERTYFFAGKTYANYYFAKEIIKFINALASLINNDYSIRNKIKIVFVADYNQSKGRRLIPAADVNEHLSIITGGSVDMTLLSYMINGSVTISSDVGLFNMFTDKNKRESIYLFGPSEQEAIDRQKNGGEYIYDYLNSNPIIKDMISFYNYLPYQDFPYNINVIIDNLLKYNDGHDVLRDLLSYYETHEQAMRDYLDKDKWMEKSMNNLAYAIDLTRDTRIRQTLISYWRNDDN